MIAQHDQEESAPAPMTSEPQLCFDWRPHVEAKGFSRGVGGGSLRPCRHRWNFGSLPPQCLEYRGYLCVRAVIKCAALLVLYTKHVLSVAVNRESCVYLQAHRESRIHLRITLNGQTAFGNKRQEVFECLLVKISW